MTYPFIKKIGFLMSFAERYKGRAEPTISEIGVHVNWMGLEMALKKINDGFGTWREWELKFWFRVLRDYLCYNSGSVCRLTALSLIKHSQSLCLCLFLVETNNSSLKLGLITSLQLIMCYQQHHRRITIIIIVRWRLNSILYSSCIL